MTAPARWSVWRPSEGPAPVPQRSKGRAVLLDEDLFAGAPAAPVVRPSPIFARGPRYVVPTRRPEVMGAVMGGEAPPFVVPAIRIETQVDIDYTPWLSALAKIRAPYRAIVVTPLERIDLTLFATAPSAWGVGCRTYWELFNLVVVVGPKVGVAHPAWVHDLREQAADAGVAFSFLSWGGPARGLPRATPEIDGRAWADVPWLHP